VPTYEYHCGQCERTFDIVQSFHDDPLTECPTCGAPVRKVFGNVGIVFKGSGFYKTDSRSGGPSKSSSGGDAAPASTETPKAGPGASGGSGDSSGASSSGSTSSGSGSVSGSTSSGSGSSGSGSSGTAKVATGS
jgi:putative FmdB family regulatory protein